MRNLRKIKERIFIRNHHRSNILFVVGPDSRESSSAQSLVGFLAKKAMKSSASSSNESCSGSFLAGFTRSRSPTAQQLPLISAAVKYHPTQLFGLGLVTQ
jgi:hypothetical protein